MIERILFNIIIGTIFFSCFTYSQECGDGYIYFEDVPNNVNNINNDYNCFYEADIAVLHDLISVNELDYNSPLEIGPQTWASGRLKIWVATYIPSGSNGITQKIDQLPENIGQLSELTTLYFEKHDLTGLPNSFTSLENLVNLYISNNWLTILPEEFGNLINLQILDLGYNQLESIPISIGNLVNIQYLLIFNNNISSLPETICNLNLDWDGINPTFQWPYFASGGNYLCDCDLIPDCVENSANINISMVQFYYSFLLDDPQNCCGEPQNCTGVSLGDINGDVSFNVLDIVALVNCVLANNCPDIENGCAGDMNGDGAYNVLDVVALANCVLANNCSG